MEIINKLFGDRFTSDKTFRGKKILFQTLTGKEKLECDSKSLGGDLIYQLDSAKAPTLARSIVTVDGVSWKEDDEVKKIMEKEENSKLPLAEAVEQVLLEKDSEVLSALYGLYSEVVEEHRKAVDGLKKG